jgi:two-component system chemotaxis sensor kinase CheA
VLVVVRDVTSSVERERAEQAQREAMNVFRRILDDRAGFEEFFRDATRLVDAIGCGAVGPVDPARIARDIHTLKGNTALFGIESVTRLCHEIESRLHEEGGSPTPAEIARIGAVWSSVRILSEQLGRSGTQTTIELRAEEYGEHLSDLARRVPHDDLAASVRNWANELASVRLQRVAEQARSIGRRLGKADVVVEVCSTPSHLRLPAAKWASFWSVFTHVVRNTLDHGIEAGRDRIAAGKPAAGRVQIALAAADACIELRVTDDGKGIAWESIRARAAALGLRHESAADLEEALYADKVSSQTTATEISGRGIGMGAVREVVRACGGSITIETALGIGTTLTFRFPIAMVDASSESALVAIETKVA